MVNLTIDQIRALMDKRSNIRNVCIIAHNNHGKSTLTDLLVSRAGIINTESGGITIKSTAIPMYYETDQEALVDIKEKTESRHFLINLIDSSGHPDFSSEATAALRVTDGAILVVDVIEGVCVQTEMVLRQALTERIRPVLVINKIDRALLELQLTKEALYSSFLRVIESVNVVITTYHDDALGNCQVYPEKGNVAFASGLHGWAFTLRQFAIRYAKKFNVDKDKMMERLWGDNFFNPATKTWTTKSSAEDGTQLERAFCMFVLDPIFRIFYSVLNYEVDTYRNLFLKLNVPMLEEDYEKKGKDLLRIFLSKFLPAAEALLEMVVIQLPSPMTAQAYRCETFYEGPNDDECAIAIKSCDPSGPLMLYVSKMVPSSDKGRFFAFGRVFSGTVKAGLKVRIQGPDYEPGTKKDLFVKTIQGTVLMMGPSAEAIEDCPAGNIIGLVGIDQFLVRSGTITTSETAHNFLTLSSKKLAVSPIVQVAVDVIKPNDLPKLIEGLKWLTKTDPSVSCTASDTGEHFVTGADVLNLERCLKNLEQDYVPIRTSDPVVSYRETITSKSSQVAVSKSANTHNHISMSAQPLNEEVCKDIEVGRIDPKDEFTVRARYLNELHNWDLNDARKIWEFGPDGVGPNILIDTTTEAVNYLNEIKDVICLAFRNASREGALANEPMRGCRFNLVDVTLHADAIHRGQGQLMPTARSCIYAAELLSEPAIMEPVYQVEIYCPQNGLDGVYSVLNRRRGHVFFEEQRSGSPIFNIKAYLPVNESFGFAADLRMATQGQAFPQSVLDHWQLMPGSPLDATSKVNAIVKAVRKRKGLSEEIPTLDLFLNRL